MRPTCRLCTTRLSTCLREENSPKDFDGTQSLTKKYEKCPGDKISQYTKNQKTLTCPRERQSTDARPEMTQMSEASDKNFTVVGVTVLGEVQPNILKMNGKMTEVPRREK